MVTKELEQESNNRFSDAVMASRELQENGIDISEEDLSIEKRVIVRDNRNKLNKHTMEQHRIENPDIDYDDIKRTLNSDRKPHFLVPRESELMQIRDMRSDSSSNASGILIEEGDKEYFYPVKISYIVRINPSDPIIDKDYYIETSSKSRAKELLSDVKSSDSSYLNSTDTDIELTLTNKIRKDSSIFTYKSCIAFGTLWFLSAAMSFGLSSTSPIVIVQAFCALTWFTLGAIKMYDKEEVEVSSFDVENFGGNISDLDLDDYLSRYVEDSSKREELSFHMTKDGIVKCVSKDSNIEWTLSENGMVPESIVSELEQVGFSGLDEAVYSAEIKPVELAESRSDNIVSDCGDWYIEFDSTKPITD